MIIIPKTAHVVHRETTENWFLPRRIIHNHELVFITEGEGLVGTDPRDFFIEKGSLLYFPPKLFHWMATGKNFLTFYGVHFSYEGYSDEKLPFGVVSKCPGFYDIKEKLERLAPLWKSGKMYSDWEMNLILSEILMILFKAFPFDNDGDDGQSGMDAALDLVHSQPRRSFTLDELCQAADMGKSKLTDEFKRRTGCTPIDYTLRLRLDLAKKDIADSIRPIKEVAGFSGFEDEFYFSRMFKRYYGISPAAYRASVKNE